MKKMSLLLAMAMLAGGSAFALWEPVPDAAGCPPTTDEEGNPYNWSWVIARTPGVAVAEYSSVPYAPLPITWRDPAEYPYDFCGYFDIIYCSLGPVAGLVPEVAEFANLVQCLYADINGPLDLEAEIPVTGNGIPDGQYELGVLAGILNDPANPLNVAATESFKQYFTEIKNVVMEALSVAELKSGDKDLRGVLYAAAPYLVPALSGVLAASATMGDADTNAALDSLLLLLADIGLTPPEGGIGALGTPLPQAGPNGDADGDGFSNKDEYNYFVGVQEYPAVDYVAAALDPEQTPPPVIQITGPDGIVPLGDDVTISVEVLIGTAVSYAWYKDDALLDDETGSALEILNAQVDDSGVYKASVSVDDGTKAVNVYEDSYELTVSEFSVPVGSALGLSIFAGACALAGAMGIRRRK